MANCGCSDTCSCVIQAGTGVSITGIGTPANPYKVSAASTDALTQYDTTNTVKLSRTGSGTQAAPYRMSADVLVASSGGVQITTNGLAVLVSAADGNSIERKADGLYASKTVAVATDANNAVEQRSTGLYVAATNAGFTPEQLGNAKLSNLGDVPSTFEAGQLLRYGSGAWTAVTLGNGLAVTGGAIVVAPKSNSGIAVDSGGVSVVVKTSGGIKTGSTGLEVDTAVVATQSDLNDLKTELFGGSTRTRVPQVEVRLGSTYNQSSGDLFAQTGWSASVDTDSIFKGSGVAGSGLTQYSRLVIPLAGRWRIEFWAESTSVTGTQAVKICLNDINVSNNSIASSLNRAGGEGTPLHAVYDGILSNGDRIYWSTFTDTATSFVPAQFGGIRSKVVARWMGPR